jgi:hypothetical protein
MPRCLRRGWIASNVVHIFKVAKTVIVNYQFILSKLKTEFGNKYILEINQDDIFIFLSHLTNGNKHNTKRNSFTALSAFFNFVASTLELYLVNPCDG